MMKPESAADYLRRVYGSKAKEKAIDFSLIAVAYGDKRTAAAYAQVSMEMQNRGKQ